MANDTTQNPGNARNLVPRRHLVSVILWTAVFTLAYAQSPLYSSNQNQYFLHGLANAGLGYLNQDWLANTLDPTPVFSGLVSLTTRVLPWSPIFYLYFGLLAGIYLFSLFGILSEIFRLDDSPARCWFTLSVLILIHSAGVRYLVVRLFDQDWAYLFDGGVAGQRLLGSVLQPSTFGVLILLSILLFLRRKIVGAVPCLVLAASFHPTYLLSAAILTLVYMGMAFQETKRMRLPLLIGAGAFLEVLPILVHTSLTFGGTDPGLRARAQELLVNFRIPHHAIPAAWFDGSVIVKIAFILVALALTRKTRLFPILVWPFGVAALGTLAQVLTGSEALALLFPWRISTWLVPLSVGVILIRSSEPIWAWLSKRVPAKTIMAASMVLAVALAGAGLAKSIREYRQVMAWSDRPMMSYVAENKASGEVYLIPLDMQDFRLVTGAPAYVEFKSIPYKDVDVLEWYRRVGLAGKLYRAAFKRVGCEIVVDLSLEGVTHVVLPYDHTIKNCSNLKKQYGDGFYEVYAVTGGRGVVISNQSSVISDQCQVISDQ
jgi:hypothetical protein